MHLTLKQIQAIERLVAQLDGQYSLEQILASGEFWAKNAREWTYIKQAGTGQIRLVCWYNFTHKPGSRERRPIIIILAVLAHLGLPVLTRLSTTQQPAAC